MRFIAQLSPEVAALGLATALDSLAGGIWLVEASEDAAAELAHLAWDLLEVVDETGSETGSETSRTALDATLARWRQAHGPLEVVALSRGLNPVAKRLSTPGGALCGVLGRGRAWLTRPRSAWLRDRFNRETARGLASAPVSRAALKWCQSRALLAWLGLAPEAVGHWLELGAAPGGITRELVRGGARVTALDHAPLAAQVAALAGVEAVRADALRWQPGARRFGGLVCDMNGPPHLALAAVARLAKALTAGAPLTVTLKLRALDARQAGLDAARVALADAGVEPLRHQHLASHRRGELALFGRVAG